MYSKVTVCKDETGALIRARWSCEHTDDVGPGTIRKPVDAGGPGRVEMLENIINEYIR